MASANAGPAEYDLAAQQTGLTNARGKTTTFTYDAFGNMLTETDPLNNVRSWTYDLAGQVTSYTDGGGIAQAYVYDDAGRQTANRIQRQGPDQRTASASPAGSRVE